MEIIAFLSRDLKIEGLKTALRMDAIESEMFLKEIKQAY